MILSEAQVDAILDQGLAGRFRSGERVLLIVPDATRTAPVADLVQRIVARLQAAGARVNVIVALGTHLPLSPEALIAHLGFDRPGGAERLASVRLMNHAWNDPSRPVSAISLVVHKGRLAHVSVGPLLESWRAAVPHAARLHIQYKPRPFRRVLSCAPEMYEDLWTGGKCMYKCEPVVADGGELIIYAPHVDSLSLVHGAAIRRIGYHVRDYFLKHLDRYAGEPRAVMGYCALVKGAGTYENGVERPRIRVSLATRVPREVCEQVGLGYVDPQTIRPALWRGREDEGVLLVERAGETLYRLGEEPGGSQVRA